MNIIGHAYVASEVIGKMNPMVAFGSQIPDIVPFIDQNIFTFEEIHECNHVFWDFVQKNYPEQTDLPLAMMSHSVKYGADKFNKEIKDLLDVSKREIKNLGEKITEASKVDYQTAVGPRLHNYLWGGMDVYLLKNKPEFACNFQVNLLKVNLNFVSKIIAEGYDKNFDEVKKILNQYYNFFDEGKISSTEDLVRILKRKTAMLPEGDKININFGVDIPELIYEMYKFRWPGILEKVIKSTQKRMFKLLNY